MLKFVLFLQKQRIYKHFRFTTQDIISFILTAA